MRFRFLSSFIAIAAIVAVIISPTVGSIAAAPPVGDVWAWGSNRAGELGDGTTTNRTSPVQVLGPGGAGTLTGVIAIASNAGFASGFNLAVKADGSVWAWGNNQLGTLGDGTTTDRTSPVQVLGPGGNGTLNGITAVSAGSFHSLALKADGSVWAWGGNSGQLGDGTTAHRHVPVQVLGPGGAGTLADIIAISAGGFHSLALKADGSVWIWGNEISPNINNLTPVQVRGPGGVGTLNGVVAISAGFIHSLALKADGSVWAWGENDSGQLGDGTTVRRNDPVQVLGPGGAGTLGGVVAISAGGRQSFALKADGSVWAWGENLDGELGDGTRTSRATPVQVLGPGGTGALTGVTAISAGNHYSLALKGDGTVWAWGDNPSGQLGDGTTTSRATPVQVLGPGGTGALTGALVIEAGGCSLIIRLSSLSPAPHDARFFPQTGYRIDNDAFWDYFNKRGGIRTFGYPVSRTFPFLGFTTQFFQREILQLAPDGSARTLNILDPGLMPYTTINGATFPGVDPAITSQAPVPGSPGYDTAVLAFVKAHAPDQFEGMNTNYYQTFLNTVSLNDAFPGGGDPNLLQGLDLEMWGVPTSNPARDPNNGNFIYLRWQRGVMHFDATNNVTQGLLLADYLKSIITGQNLPADLASQSSGSRFFKQYNPAKPKWIDRPNDLPATDLTNAFQTE